MTGAHSWNEVEGPGDPAASALEAGTSAVATASALEPAASGTTTAPPARPSSEPRRIPSLDGLRALSIAAVLVGHLAGTVNFPSAVGGLIRDNGLIDIANVGVRVFFVISGFLITGILMKDAQGKGISLRRFYLRRTMRIFPAYYAFVGSIVVLSVFGVFGVRLVDVAHALTYTVNYQVDHVKQFGHLWSLAVEEQFYLLWPLTIVLLGLRRARWAVVAILVAAPLLRAIEYHYIPAWDDIVGNTFETTADAIAMGCLLALTLDVLRENRWFVWVLDHALAIPALIAVALVLGKWGVSNLLLSVTVLNLSIMLGVAYCVLRPTTLAGRLLNTRPLVYVGALSYSIYLWQQVFVNRESDAWYTTFPINIVLAAGFALASYYLIERPFLRLRPRVEHRLLDTRQEAAATGEPGPSAPAAA